MGAALNDYAAIEDDDFVAVFDRAETVRHNDAATTALADAFVNVLFGFVVEGAGGFVED